MNRNEDKILNNCREAIPPLSEIYFYLTEGCNLACRHCWLSPGFDPSGIKYSSLPIEFFEIAIREAKPLGLESVKLTGGEPLLHPRINSLFEIIRRENLSLRIETNGMLCSPEIAAEIAKSPRRFVSVSIDGANSETHDWIRGVPGSFEKAKQAVRNLATSGTRPQIIMTLMRHNIGQVEDVFHLAEELGASSLKLNIMQPTARGEALSKTEENLSIADQISLLNKIEREIAPKGKIGLFHDTPAAFWPLSGIFKGNSLGLCHMHNILGVLPNGHYALCGIGAHIPDLVFGKVGVDRLEHLWKENPFLKELRIGLPDRLTGTCSKCLIKDFCLGSCIAQNYYSTGSIWGSHWFCDQAFKEGLFPKTRLL